MKVMFLADKDILQYVKLGKLVIKPFVKSQVVCKAMKQHLKSAGVLG